MLHRSFKEAYPGLMHQVQEIDAGDVKGVYKRCTGAAGPGLLKQEVPRKLTSDERASARSRSSLAALQVLDTDAGNVKALYRRAQAQLALGYFIEAQQDVKAVLLQVSSSSCTSRRCDGSCVVFVSGKRPALEEQWGCGPRCRYLPCAAVCA